MSLNWARTHQHLHLQLEFGPVASTSLSQVHLAVKTHGVELLASEPCLAQEIISHAQVLIPDVEVQGIAHTVSCYAPLILPLWVQAVINHLSRESHGELAGDGADTVGVGEALAGHVVGIPQTRCAHDGNLEFDTLNVALHLGRDEAVRHFRLVGDEVHHLTQAFKAPQSSKRIKLLLLPGSSPGERHTSDAACEGPEPSAQGIKEAPEDDQSTEAERHQAQKQKAQHRGNAVSKDKEVHDPLCEARDNAGAPVEEVQALGEAAHHV
mmetsp:Transcript_64466/g.149929  ORF Transcript_64466/g.149929 Transcript_64466/m.149929 type:complete len:267 (-) Transcript_64466:45-845(-)